MSITALVTGRLVADPESRIGKSGKAFTLSKLSAFSDDGAVYVSVIAFGDAAEQLARLCKGETAAVSGRLKVGTWTNREGVTAANLSITADAVLSAHRVPRAATRKAKDVRSPADPAYPTDHDESERQ